MGKKVLLLLVSLFITILNINPLYRTPEGGRVYFWTLSPDLLSLGMGLGGSEKPSGFTINPAGNAFVQNVKVEASYGVAPGFVPQNGESFNSAGDFFVPFIVNGGFIVPSRYGNFSGYLSYMNMSNRGFAVSGNNDTGIGKIGSVYFGFSKDYSDNFAFGLSGDMKFSYNPLTDRNKFDVGGAIDVGFIFKPEWYFPISKSSKAWGAQDFQFSVLVKELGKPLFNFASDENNTLGWFALPFTPGLGFSFNAYNDGSTYWKILADVSTPFFQNFVFALGTEVQIMKFIALKGSYTVDIEGILERSGVIPQYEYMYNIYNFSGGISFKFSSNTFKKMSKSELSEKKHLTTEFSVDLGVKPYANGMIFEAGCVVQIGMKDNNPPVVKYNQIDTYASPNFDGIQDRIQIGLDIKDERYIRSWKLVIYDKDGKVVRNIASKEERKESLNIKTVIKRYFSPKTGIPIPEKVEWDGKDNNGSIVSDGSYTFKFFAMDDNKNTNPEGTAAGTIYIDTDKPEMKANITNQIFSPNGDGSKDSMIIDLDIIKGEVLNVIETDDILFDIHKNVYEKIETETVNSEVKSQKWYVDIKNTADKIIRRYDFDSTGSKKIDWDGKDDKGNQVADGVYKVVLHSTDLAGNYNEEVITNIIINTEPTPIEVSIDKGVFSPNTDSINDTIKFKFNIPVKTGIERWELEVFDSSKKIVKTFAGEKQPPEYLEWDGKNDKFDLVKEGDFKSKLTVYYINGNKPFGETPQFVVDNTPPEGKVTNFVNIFSPNGDGNKDEASIEQITSKEEEWRGYIYDKNGKIVKNFIWKSQAPKKFSWDGKSNDGKLVPDGEYIYQLKSTDIAGNSFETNKYNIKIDTEDVPLFISSSERYFSPNGDGVKDSQVFEIKTKSGTEKNVSEWGLDVVNDREEVVYSQNGKGSLPGTIIWDGKGKSNKISDDGNYYARINVNFDSGNISSSKTGFFTVDTIAPNIALKTVTDVFSPNGDKNLDAFEILQTGTKEEYWEASIADNLNKNIWKVFYSDSEPKQKEFWDGKDSSGNTMKNGVYKYTITGKDKAGNTASASIDKIELKNIYTSLFLTLSDDKLSPNDDGKYDNIELIPFVGVKEDVAAYKVDILNEKGESVKTFQAKGSVPEKIVWDGRDNGNNIAVDGKYKSKMTVLYRFGNTPVVETTPFNLDTTPPEVNISYIPEYFSPDDDNVDDELSININANDATGINNWKLSVVNPQTGKIFTAFTGEGKPADIVKWNGISLKGDLVDSAEDYPVRVYAVDNAGNVLDKEVSPIMVDILVVKQPDGRLKIKISNIEFKPDSAQTTDSPKNTKVLSLLSRALKKYGSYSITIEGHANKFAEGLDEVKAKKLSDERSKTIALRLKELGISMARMTTTGKGFDEPLVPLTPNADKDELAKNRRVEFYLQK